MQLGKLEIISIQCGMFKLVLSDNFSYIYNILTKGHTTVFFDNDNQFLFLMFCECKMLVD